MNTNEAIKTLRSTTKSLQAGCRVCLHDSELAARHLRTLPSASHSATAVCKALTSYKLAKIRMGA